MKGMTPVMYRTLQEIKRRREMPDEFMNRATRDALFRHGFIEECTKLYFGPRDLRWRLTDLGKKYIP